MDWTPYNKQLDNLFGAASFDTLGKMGYAVWGNESANYDEGEDEYTAILAEHHNTWNALTPAEKAEEFIEYFNGRMSFPFGEGGLKALLDSENVSIVQ
jgi:hypothetical protein